MEKCNHEPINLNINPIISQCRYCGVFIHPNSETDLLAEQIREFLTLQMEQAVIETEKDIIEITQEIIAIINDNKI